MKIESKLQLEVITSNSITNLKTQVNSFFSNHKVRNVQYNQNGVEFTAFIHFEDDVKIPEDIRDEFIIRGEKYRCEECRYWGTNYRDEPSDCFKCMANVTRKGVRGCNPACLFFYENLARGEQIIYDKYTRELE